MVIERKKRHLERYLEIGRILARHGWESLISRIGLTGMFRIRRTRDDILPTPEQVRAALEELGPTFIKLGQMLSARPDLVPPAYIQALEKLQDSAQAIPFEKVRQIVETELKQPLETVFLHFEETPLACASIGQTHNATLADGSPVVVKVQRPNARKIIENDLEILGGVARFLEHRFEVARVFRLSELVDEFSVTIQQELDFTQEGRNGETLRRNLADCKYVRVAATIWKQTTTRVLTLERLEGIKITDFHRLETAGYDRQRIASNLSKIFLHMVFIDGLFHGDPHPGNLAVLENEVIGLMDYGVVGRLQHSLRTYVRMLFAYYIQQDSASFAQVILTMGRFPPSLDIKSFEESIDRLLRPYYGAPVGAINIGEILSGALKISARYRVSLPSSLALLTKVIIEVETIDNLLDPNYDLVAEARPFIFHSIRSEFSVCELRKELLGSLLSWKLLLLKLPHHTSNLLEQIVSGTLKITFMHEGLDNSIREIDKSANRLSLALIASATILASATIISSQVEPVWRGFSLPGVVGFAIAFLFGIWLIVAIIKSGRW